MNTEKPNVLIELPHGGNLIPSEVCPYIDKSFTADDMRRDADEFSDEIFYKLDVPHQMVRSDFWRAFIDVNRSIDNRGSDGVVKTNTSQGIQIYKSEDGLPPDIADLVIEKHVRPYRERFLAVLGQPEITQLIMCHTMPGMGTQNSLAEDPGTYRPLFSLINEGDEHGNTPEGHPFASGQRIHLVGDIIRKHIPNFDTDFKYSEALTYNFPYNNFSRAREFDISHYEGKNAFSFEVNRNLFHHNLGNVAAMRALMVEIVSKLSEQG